MAKLIYCAADIATALGVTRSAVTNWFNRRDDWPEADFETPDGRMFWSDLDPWCVWHDNEVGTEQAKARIKLLTQQLATARKELAELGWVGDEQQSTP